MISARTGDILFPVRLRYTRGIMLDSCELHLSRRAARPNLLLRYSRQGLQENAHARSQNIRG